MNGVLIFAVITALVALYVYARIRSMNRREAEEARLDAAALAEARKRHAAALAEAEKQRSAAMDAPAEAAEPAPAASPVAQEKAPAQWRSYFKGNNMFAGECVAFTGTLSGMTRREAIAAVEANGGKAFGRPMPACTTMLVVADKGAGKGKLDLADQRIGQVKKITERAFKSMLSMQLTVTPEELAAAFAKYNA